MSEVNKVQFDQWNSPVQRRLWPKREVATVRVTPRLLDALALKPGERVLEIGSGGGLAAIDAAARVGPTGSVLGFDISQPLTELASERAAEKKISNVRFVAGDAQTDAIPGAPYDAAMSQFGVMFFSDPVAAFTNIHNHLKPGGRMVFACWQPAEKNTWFVGPVLAPYQPPPPPMPPGAPPPGPFALGDAAYVSGILEKAGFTGVTVEEFEFEAEMPLDALIDHETVELLPVDAARKEQAWADLQAHGEKLGARDGMLRLTMRPQLVRAQKP